MAQVPLNSLRVFEAVARHGSFGHAAEELCVTQSAVSHQIRNLEEWLGAPLFDREGNRPRLRPNGVELGHALTMALGDIDTACRLARRSVGPPELTVAVIPSVAICWLIPRLGEFQARAPKTDIRILYAIHGKDTDFRDADVAVIFSKGAPEVPGMTATRFLSGASAPVCSPAFSAAHGALSTPEAILQAGLLHDTDLCSWQAWLEAAGCAEQAVPAGPVFQDFNLLRIAALAGQGVALCPPAIIRDDLTSGRLVQLSDRTVMDDHDYYVLQRLSGGRSVPGVHTAFCKWLLGTPLEV